MTPTARSLKLLRASGYIVAIVERWIPMANVRKDAFGWADLLAAHPLRRELVLLQVTTRPHLADRLKKAKALPELQAWLNAGGLAWFHGWKKVGNRWEVKQVEVGAGDLADVVARPARRRGRVAKQLELFG